MNEDIKMFHIGIVMLVLMGVITVGLQVCYRVQNDERARVRRETVRVQQDIDKAQILFESQIGWLRNMVDGVLNKPEFISFQKTIEIQNLPDRISEK